MAEAVECAEGALPVSDTYKERPRHPSGKFQPGDPKPKSSGRKRGEKPKTVLEKILAGISRSKTAGGAGIEGFARNLATKHPSAAAGLLAKVITATTAEAPAATAPSEPSLQVTSIPPGYSFRRAKFIGEDGVEKDGDLLLIPDEEAWCLLHPGREYPFSDEPAAEPEHSADVIRYPRSV